jgi:hypothetical protein
MTAFGSVVIGKRSTLGTSGAVGPDEIPLEWPDQGGAERNWALNRVLLDGVIAAGGPIRDADAAWGVLRGHSGFLARERAHIRAAGLRLGAGGCWSRARLWSLIDLVPIWLVRARQAAATGLSTFSIPEAAPVAAWIAAKVAHPSLSARAVAWLARGAGYHELVRLCARAVRALDAATFVPIFGPKAGAELEPMLALWPHALVVPTPATLSRVDLIRLRALPVHPLGLVAQPSWADGGWLSPSEYFFHDLDHARFKIREDLSSSGRSIPDAYRDGSTIEPRTGAHRTILPFAAAQIGGRRRRAGDARWASALLHRMAAIREPATARAAELLLFEIVHEKSLPLDRSAVGRALGDEQHLAKLWRKHATGFFRAGDRDRADTEVMRALGHARGVLAELCA